jgi:hypothetical protein
MPIEELKEAILKCLNEGYACESTPWPRVNFSIIFDEDRFGNAEILFLSRLVSENPDLDVCLNLHRPGEFSMCIRSKKAMERDHYG